MGVSRQVSHFLVFSVPAFKSKWGIEVRERLSEGQSERKELRGWGEKSVEIETKKKSVYTGPSQTTVNNPAQCFTYCMHKLMSLITIFNWTIPLYAHTEKKYSLGQLKINSLFVTAKFICSSQILFI